MKTIIFPTDFSEASAHAWQHTMMIAEGLKAKILLLHAFTPEKVTVGATIPDLMDFDTAEKKMEAYIQEAKARGIDSASLTSSLCEGNFIEIMKATAELQKPDLIIMGTQGHKSIYESGSMTAKIISATSVPTLVIPIDSPINKISHIAYASDFEEENMDRVKQLLLLAQEMDAQLSCIHVRGHNDYWSRLQASFYEQLYNLDQNVGRFEFYIINQEDVLTSLEVFVKQNKVDVLVMLTHDDPKRELADSHTYNMAMKTKTPLWVLHN